MIRLFSKKTFKFKNPDNGEIKCSKYNELISLPDWVQKDPTFELGLKTGDIILSQNKQEEQVINKVAIGEIPQTSEQEEAMQEEIVPEEIKNEGKSKSSTNSKK